MIRNLIRRKFFNSKSSFFTKTFSVKLMQSRKIFIQNDAFSKLIFFKIVLFIIAFKTRNLRILRGKLNQNVIFLCAKTFSKPTFQKFLFFLKIIIFENLVSFKIWRVVQTEFQNLTRCKKLSGKTDFCRFSGSDWMMVSSVNVNTNVF